MKLVSVPLRYYTPQCLFSCCKCLSLTVGFLVETKNVWKWVFCVLCQSLILFNPVSLCATEWSFQFPGIFQFVCTNRDMKAMREVLFHIGHSQSVGSLLLPVITMYTEMSAPLLPFNTSLWNVYMIFSSLTCILHCCWDLKRHFLSY